MALGFIVNPTYDYSSRCKVELPRFHTLGSLLSHRRLLHFRSPRRPRISVLASSVWTHQGEANCGSTYELSSVFLDILKQRRESGLRNDVDNDSRRHVEDARNYETMSGSSEGDEEDWAWERSDEGSGPSISKSYPSIPAKFSKYTRGRNTNGGNSRSLRVKQQLREKNSQNREYFKEKSVFFQDFVSPVVKPEQPCQYSYSEHPSIPPIGFREPLYSPFGPKNMVRPWTGKRPYEPRTGKPRPEFDSFKLPPAAMTKARFVQPPGPFVEGTGPKLGRTRKEILGEPLSHDEVRELVAEACVERRRLDLGKDGLTHNMLDLLHRHWKRRRVCRIKCFGVPTVDMGNLCRVIEDKSGGKIIRRSKSMLYVFRGRNYNWATRPEIPLMLWKPPAPIYPPVVQRVPEGLSEEEADNLRLFGQRAHCLCRLKKAGMYHNLVKTVKEALEIDEVVKVDCRELDRSDMKKIGAKLRDLVPCVPLSFDRLFMLLWKGTRETQKRIEEEDVSGAEEIEHRGSEFRHHEARPDCESDHNEAQEQLCRENEHHSSRVNCNTKTRESADIILEGPDEAMVMNGDKSINATAVVGSDQAVSEFDRLWEAAIKSNELVMLDEFEADLESVLETCNGDSQSSNYTSDSREKHFSEPDVESSVMLDGFEADLESVLETCNGDSQSSNYTSDIWEEHFSEPDVESSELDEGGSTTLETWTVPGREEDQDEEELEEVPNSENLLPCSLTDISIPQDELERLCALRLTIRGWMKIGTQGITRGIVKSIHSKWLVSEVAKVTCIVPGWSMSKVHEDLERLSGGIVIWREGPAVVVYRGKDYVPGWMRKFEEREEAYRERLQLLGLDEEDEEKLKRDNPQTTKFEETEIDELLDDLGPEYTEWNEGGHVPVDADLLLPPPSGFKSPFRLLPYGVRPRLTNVEMTEIRHLARSLPPHFALGKRRGLEGLASAMVKLWEKSEVAKVVMKRGVSRIDNDRMAAELMRLTGGDLIARNMSYIALFRGNNFLPLAVKHTLEEKDRAATSLLEDEERARLAPFVDAPLKPSNAGTLAESLEQGARLNPWKNGVDCSNQMILARKAVRDQAVQRMQRIIKAVSHKIYRAERELKNINLKMRPKGTIADEERISDEEMYTLRKIGLRMKPFLLLGRREVFGGIIENMHLNWKWRELVKIILKESYFMYRDKDEVEKIARMLEAESGGVLVGICPIPVGVAVIVYRGKQYQRPIDGVSPHGHPHGLRPRGLLTKEQAWQRFNQKRRKLSLERHLKKLERDFNVLQIDLKKLEEQDLEDFILEASTASTPAFD